MANKKKSVAVNIPVVIDVTEDGQESVLDKFFSANDHSEAEPVTETRQEESAKAKQSKKPFSFRADPEQVKIWKVYAQTAGMKMEDLGAAAFNEYIKNHALDGRLQTIFELSVNK